MMLSSIPLVILIVMLPSGYIHISSNRSFAWWNFKVTQALFNLSAQGKGLFAFLFVQLS
jgi:hypothetical protein